MATADKNIRELAYQHIQKKIVDGVLRAGEALSEVALARELGSSRTPVREAIGQLAAEGFLAQVPSRGAVVVQLTRNDIVDLYELREALEVFAVGKVARRGVEVAEAARLRELAEEPMALRDELRRSKAVSLDAARMKRFMAADLAFHTLLMRCAGNWRILKVVSDSRLLIRIFSMRREGHDAAQLGQIHDSHNGILDAVMRGNAAKAMRLTSEHIAQSREERLACFDKWERETALERTSALLLEPPPPRKRARR